MGLFGGGGSSKQDTPMADAQGQIAQEQWQDYLNRFVPLENEMIEMSDSGTSTLSGGFDETPDLKTHTQNYSTDYFVDPITGKEVKDVDKWNRDNDYAYRKAKKRWKKGKSWEYADKWGNGKRSRFGVSGAYARDGREGSVKIGKRSKNKKRFVNKWGLQKAQRTGSKQVVSKLDRALMGSDVLNYKRHTAQEASGLRRAARFGGMTDAQKAEYERKADLNRSKSRMGLRNATRDIYRDRDLNISGQMMGIGRGLANNATQGLAAAAGNEASRNATNMQMKAQQRQSTMSTLGTVAGIAAMAMFSSERFKENVEACQTDDLIAKLNSVKLYEFDYLEGMQIPGKHYGPILEEVPEEFRLDEDQLNPYNLIGALIATVQQLQSRVDELENKE